MAKPAKRQQLLPSTHIVGLKVRSRRNLRFHVATFVFFFAGLFLATLVFLAANFSGLEFSRRTTPEWIAMAIATPILIAAGVLAAISVRGKSSEHKKNLQSIAAFALTIAGYAIMIGVLEIVD